MVVSWEIREKKCVENMYQSEIEHLLKNYYYFKGVFSADKIPTLKPFEFCIVNTVSSEEKIGHWISIGCHPFTEDTKNTKNQTYEIFNPLGNSTDEVLHYSKSGNWKKGRDRKSVV